MSLARTTPAVAVIAAIALGGTAAAADTPVGPQQTYTGSAAPASFAGAHLHRGAHLPADAKIVYREVHLPAHQHAKLTLTVPRGTSINGIAATGTFRLQLPKKTSAYIHHRRVTVTVSSTGDAASGRFYALGRG